MRVVWSSKLINYIFVAFAFVLPIFTAMTNLASALLIILWVVEGDWRRKYDILKQSKPFLLFMALILLFGLSILWSDSIHGGFSHNAKNAITYYFSFYIFGFLIFPIILTSIKPRYMKYAITAFLGAMFVSEMMSWGIFLELIQYKHKSPHDPAPFSRARPAHESAGGAEP